MYMIYFKSYMLKNIYLVINYNIKHYFQIYSYKTTLVMYIYFVEKDYIKKIINDFMIII